MDESDDNQEKWFSGIEEIISNPLKFKIKLAIGEDAYASLRIKKKLWEIWDTAGVAGTPAALVKLLGVSATPIGWLIVAGVVTGGAWLGITRYLKNKDNDKVDVIPKFINTPLDILALGLFELIAPLALKVANVDDHIDSSERQAISSYFVKEWGYDQRFIEEGISFSESKLSDYKIKDLAQTLAEFQKQNPDCNYNSMSKEIVSFLKTVIESDGRIDEREEMAVEKVKRIFDEVDQINIAQMTKSGIETISDTVISSSRAIKTKTVEAFDKSSDLASDAISTMKNHGGKTAEFVSETCDSAMTQGKKVLEGLKSKVMTIKS